jgi:hypothetical protein
VLHNPQIGVHLGSIAMERSESVEFGFGVCELALHAHKAREVQARLEEFRPQRERPFEADPGSLCIVACVVHCTELIECFGNVRPHRNGSFEERLSLFVVTTLMDDETEEAQGIELLRIRRKHLSVAGFGFSQLSCLMMGYRASEQYLLRI